MSIHKPVRFITVTADSAGQRLDNFLLSELKTVPKSRIYRIIRKGEVRVNKGRCKPLYRLQVGDQVRIPPVVQAESTPVFIPDYWLHQLKAAIIHEDDDVIILNKPAGLAVHSGSGVAFGVIDILRQAHQPGWEHLSLVHRLDRATSGCLLIAKQRQSLLSLQQQLTTHTLKKYYRAWLCGKIPYQQREITVPLADQHSPDGERRVVADAQGKSAYTMLKVRQVKTLSIEQQFIDLTEVDVMIKTGRTHQIRVHTAYIDYPVLGDAKYGNSVLNQRVHKLFDASPLFLHAHRLQFSLSQQAYDVSAPVPAYFEFIHKQ